MIRTPFLAAAAAAALIAPAAAAGQEPGIAPVPAKAALTLEAERTHRAGDTDLVLAGDSFRLRGTLLPAVPDVAQRVVLRVYRDGKARRAVRATVAPDGTFAVPMPAGRPGRLSVRVHHPASPQLAARRGPKVSVSVARPYLRAGDDGALVRLLQRGLRKLRYAVPTNDAFDSATGRAVMAYRKVNGMVRTYEADERVIRRVLAGKGAFKVRHPDAGRHVEADISRQVLALVDGDEVVATYHTSSGAPSTPTVIGSFRVYRKDPGTNSLGMVHSAYFIRGYAIHGYVDVPAFNASHGCLRVPIPDAWRIYSWLNHGDRVIVYP